MHCKMLNPLCTPDPHMYDTRTHSPSDSHTQHILDRTNNDPRYKSNSSYLMFSTLDRRNLHMLCRSYPSHNHAQHKYDPHCSSSIHRCMSCMLRRSYEVAASHKSYIPNPKNLYHNRTEHRKFLVTRNQDDTKRMYDHSFEGRLQHKFHNLLTLM